jgi:acetylornithine deacetylase/succinyl-diaminopimelate desuccinylase-like protein
VSRFAKSAEADWVQCLLKVVRFNGLCRSRRGVFSIGELGSIMRALSAAFFSLLLSCAKPMPPQTPYVPKQAEPDWDKTTQEAALILQSLIQIPSVNPPDPKRPNAELEVAQKMAEILQKEGIESVVVESAPGRGNIMARLKGSGAKRPLVLLCHLDVVPIEANGWTYEPFAGIIKDGYIFGRGAIDDKGMCTANLMAFISLKRQGIQLQRDVVFLSTADEESAGSGVEFMLEKFPQELEAEYLFNEGGIILQDAVEKGQTLVAISAAEKGTVGIKLTATGKPGHGSIPRPNQAPDQLREALLALSEIEPEMQMHIYVKELVLRLGEHKKGPVGFLMRHPGLAEGVILKGLAASPTNKAIITNTINLTMLNTGDKINVVPGTAEAQVDVRVLPGTSPESMKKLIEETMKEAKLDIKVELLYGSNATTSSWDTDLFRSMEKHMTEGIKNCIAAPILSPGYTDSRPFRARGTIAYGIVPFHVTDDEFAGMHGNDERLKLSELGAGIRRTYRVLVDVVQ